MILVCDAFLYRKDSAGACHALRYEEAQLVVVIIRIRLQPQPRETPTLMAQLALVLR